MYGEDFLTVTEAAAALKVTLLLVRNWCKAEQLPYCWVGRDFHIPRDALAY